MSGLNHTQLLEEANRCLKCKEPDPLWLGFRDNGKPYNSLDAKTPDITAAAEERTIGGLGLFMVRKRMDKVEYMYQDGQNVLTLTMKVSWTIRHDRTRQAMADQKRRYGNELYCGISAQTKWNQ